MSERGLGPTVEEFNELGLKRLREKYGDHPPEELQRMAREALAKKMAAYTEEDLVSP